MGDSLLKGFVARSSGEPIVIGEDKIESFAENGDRGDFGEDTVEGETGELSGQGLFWLLLRRKLSFPTVGMRLV